MEKLNLPNLSDVETNELIASEQKKLFFSIRLKLSALTHQFQLILRANPKQLRNLLHLYQNFLVFKGRLEDHFMQEQAVIDTFAPEASEENFTIHPVYFTEQLLFLEQPLKQLKAELAGIINILHDIRAKYNALKNEFGGLGKLSKELENLNLFLSVHKNLLKYLFAHKLIQAEHEVTYYSEAG